MTGTVYDESNIFAKIVRGEIPARKLLENDHAIAFHDIAPKAPVHVLVIPKGSYRTMDDFMEKADDAEILSFNRALAEAVRMAGLQSGGYRLISNNGPDSGQEVPHFHIHVLGGRQLGPLLADR